MTSGGHRPRSHRRRLATLREKIASLGAVMRESL